MTVATSRATHPTPSRKRYIVVPYTKGVSENFKKACGKHRIQIISEEGSSKKWGDIQVHMQQSGL